jgi:peptidoglycan/LPS O-acetylase OafA/YrhL
LKGGEKMKVPNKYIIYLACLILISFILKFLLSYEIKVHLFIGIELIQTLIIAYLVYTFFELKVLNEKQGSKLAKTKQKLYQTTWD